MFLPVFIHSPVSVFASNTHGIPAKQSKYPEVIQYPFIQAKGFSEHLDTRQVTARCASYIK